MSRTVQELLDDVRAQADEADSNNLTDAQILAALNRGQRHATNITARKYEDLFWAKTTTTTVAGQREYDIPDAVFGKRVEALDVVVGGTAYKLQRINNHKKSQFTYSNQTARPYYYAVIKNKFELFPTPTGGLTINIHYTEAPEALVKPQGRITTVNSASNYVITADLGGDISTTTTGFGSYINFIDYNTGAVKGTAQVSAIDTTTGQVTFKSSGLTRPTVLGKTVATSLPSDLEADDYICLVTGTCVPELPDAYSDYLIQYAVLEVRRRFGESTQEEYAALKGLEDELLKMWAGRETTHRVRKAARAFDSGPGSSIRRLFS